MAYSRFFDSRWYVYPTKSEDGKTIVVCIRADGFDTYFWESDVAYEDFIKEVTAQMRKDNWYDADLAELKEILQRNIGSIKEDLDGSSF